MLLMRTWQFFIIRHRFHGLLDRHIEYRRSQLSFDAELFGVWYTSFSGWISRLKLCCPHRQLLTFKPGNLGLIYGNCHMGNLRITSFAYFNSSFLIRNIVFFGFLSFVLNVFHGILSQVLTKATHRRPIKHYNHIYRTIITNLSS